MDRSVFLIAVLSVLSLVTADCDAGGIQGVKQCYSTYLAGYNLTLIDNRLPPYWTFHNTRLGWVASNGLVDALPQICDLYFDLQRCIQKYPCVSLHDYETSIGPANNTGDDDLYWQDFAVSNYQCGKGYAIFMNEGYCIGAAREKYGTELNQCITDYSPNIQKMGYCKAEQTLLNCQQNIFQKACDWNAGVFMCNCILAGFTSMDTTCSSTNQVSCPNPRSMSLMRSGRFAIHPGLF